MQSDKFEDDLLNWNLRYDSGKVSFVKIAGIFLGMGFGTALLMFILVGGFQFLDALFRGIQYFNDELLNILIAVSAAFYIMPLSLIIPYLIWLWQRPFRRVEVYDEGIILYRGKYNVRIPFDKIVEIGSPP